MTIYELINRRTHISSAVCDSLATAQIIAEGISRRALEWHEVVSGEDDDIGLNWLSSDGRWDIAETHIVTYADALKTWTKV